MLLKGGFGVSGESFRALRLSSWFVIVWDSFGECILVLIFIEVFVLCKSRNAWGKQCWQSWLSGCKFGVSIQLSNQSKREREREREIECVSKMWL